MTARNYNEWPPHQRFEPYRDGRLGKKPIQLRPQMMAFVLNAKPVMAASIGRVPAVPGYWNVRQHTGFACVALLTLVLTGPLRAADVEYVKDIKSLLAHKCIACHGPLRQEAGLRLDAGKLIHRGSDSGPVLTRRTSAESLIVKKVSAADPSERMPPEGEGTPLTAEEIANLKEWIDQGAEFPEEEVVLHDPKRHWAYLVPQRPA